MGLDGARDKSDSGPSDRAADSHMGLGSTYDDGGYYQGLFDKLSYGGPQPRTRYPSSYFTEHDLPLPSPFRGPMSNDAAWRMNQTNGSSLRQDGHNYICNYPSNAGLYFKGQRARQLSPRYVPMGNNMGNNMSWTYAKGLGDSDRPDDVSIRRAQVLTETLQAQSYSSVRGVGVRQPNVHDAEEDHMSWRVDKHRPHDNETMRTPMLDYD